MPEAALIPKRKIILSVTEANVPNHQNLMAEATVVTKLAMPVHKVHAKWLRSLLTPHQRVNAATGKLSVPILFRPVFPTGCAQI